MQEEGSAGTARGNGQGEGHPVADMAALVRRVRAFAASCRSGVRTEPEPLPRSRLQQAFGFTGRQNRKPEIVLSEEVAVELGHPSTASRAVVLTTFEAQAVTDGRVTVIGPELDALGNGERRPFALVVLLSAPPEDPPDPFEAESVLYLMNRLPGYMVRSVPGKLWVRVSKAAVARGLTLGVVGSAVVHAYREAFPGLRAVEVLFVTSDGEAVEELGTIATEASILAGRHKKLVLGVDGSVECTELNCETCEEKPVCDSLRDVVIQRRRQAP